MTQTIKRMFCDAAKIADATTWLNEQWKSWSKLDESPKLSAAILNGWTELLRLCNDEGPLASELLALSAIADLLNDDGELPQRLKRKANQRLKAASVIDGVGEMHLIPYFETASRLFQLQVPRV